MTDEQEQDDALRRALHAHDAPPPMPAESIWAGIESGLARAREHRTATRRLHVPLAGAIAASLALFAGGAAMGYGMSASGGAPDTQAVRRDAREGIDTPATTDAVPGDTIQVAWF